MEKDFDGWNRVKKSADLRRDIDRLFFKEREVWWCMLGVNIGFEQNGKGKRSQRPILVVKKFNQYVMIVIPLTTKIKKNPFYRVILCPDGVKRSVIISQIRLIDIRRLTEKMFVVDEEVFKNIKKAINKLFL